MELNRHNTAITEHSKELMGKKSSAAVSCPAQIWKTVAKMIEIQLLLFLTEWKVHWNYSAAFQCLSPHYQFLRNVVCRGESSPPQETSWYVCWWVFTASFDIAIPDYIAISVCESRCQANDDRPPLKAKLSQITLVRGLSSEKWLPIKCTMLFRHDATIKWGFNNCWSRNFPAQTLNGLIISWLKWWTVCTVSLSSYTPISSFH